MTGHPKPASLLLSALLLAGNAVPVPSPLGAQTPSQDAAPIAQGQTAENTPVVAAPRHAAYPSRTTTALGARIASLLNDPRVAGAHWGIAVTTIDGTPLYGLDEAKLFRPASTAKLFTTAAAMAILGPDSTISTGIYGDLDNSTGTVDGDLVIVGAGDPSFGTADLPYRSSAVEGEGASATATARDLRALTNQLVTAGVHKITGNIVGDATLFSPEPPPQGWSDEDLVWGYGALPNALSIADNELLVSVTPKLPGPSPKGGTTMNAAVAVAQVVPYLKVIPWITTLNPDPAQRAGIAWLRSSTNPAVVEANGIITSGHAPVQERLAIADPAQYTAQALQAQLLEHDIEVQGRAVGFPGVHQWPQSFLTTLRGANPCGVAALGGAASCAYSCLITPHPTRMLASHISPPLQEDVVFTLKTSANLHAEMLLHRLGLKNACPGDTTLDGARMIRTWLLQTGIADQDFVFYDGSGLSTKDLVTPRAEAQLLAYPATQPWFPQWKAALPVGGVDGTLAARFTQPPLKGHVFAKTGTLGESRALAGYVQCASGRELIFAILDDNHQPGSTADRAVMDKIVAAIAEMD